MANEKRLIDANALTAEYDRVHIGPPGGARKLMEDAPTVDAVEVCRCKDCVWCRYSKVHDVQWCDHESGLCDAIVGNEFCSYGERRNNEPEKPV